MRERCSISWEVYCFGAYSQTMEDLPAYSQTMEDILSNYGRPTCILSNYGRPTYIISNYGRYTLKLWKTHLHTLKLWKTYLSRSGRPWQRPTIMECRCYGHAWHSIGHKSLGSVFSGMPPLPTPASKLLDPPPASNSWLHLLEVSE